MIVGRFMFTPTWKVTRLGFIRPLFSKGCDEYHNKSRYLIVPLIGMFVWFQTNNRDTPHTVAWIDGTPDVPPTPGCDICDEMMEPLHNIDPDGPMPGRDLFDVLGFDPDDPEVIAAYQKAEREHNARIANLPAILATEIDQLDTYNGDARLYHLSAPVTYGSGLRTEYVIVSAVDNSMFCETYIFPADHNGNVIDWSELPGSFQGAADHDEAIDNAGWVTA